MLKSFQSGIQKALVISSISVIAVQAWAEKSMESTAQINSASRSAQYLSKGIQAMLSYSVLNGTSSSIGGTGEYDAEFAVPGGIGIGARYNAIRSDGFGATLGGRYEFIGRSREFEVRSNGKKLPSGGFPSFNLLVLEGNLTFEMEGGYFIGGANYVIPAGVSMGGNGAMSGGFGGQVGLGWVLGDKFSNVSLGKNSLSLEALAQIYRVSFSGAASGIASGSNSNDQMMGGVILRAGYGFL